MGQRLKGPITEAVNVRHLAVPITVALGEQLWRRVEEDDALEETLRDAIERLIEEDLVDLGLPGHPVAQVRRASSAESEAVAVVVHDNRCLRPPDWIEELVRRLTGRSAAELSEAQVESFVDVVATGVRELVRSRPSVLFGLPQAHVYAAKLPKPDLPELMGDWPPSVEHMHSMLGPVLDLRISVRDSATVSNVVARAQHRPTAECIEQLIAALRPPVVEIHLHRDFLREMTLDAPFDADAFPGIRTILFKELGALYPDFRFTLAEEIPLGAFAFRLNHLRTPLYRSERPGAKDIETALGHLVHALASELRAQADAFLHSGHVVEQLLELELFYPSLVRLVSDELSAEQIASYLRALLNEGESIRDLRHILEVVLRTASAEVEPADAILLDSRLAVDNGGFERRHPQLTFAFVRLTKYREQLRSGLAAEHRITVHPVSADVEDLLRQSIDGLGRGKYDLPSSITDQIVEAVWAVGGGRTPSHPLLVSSLHLRRPLRRLLATIAPDLEVIAIQEVPLGLTIDRDETVTLVRVPAPAGT